MHEEKGRESAGGSEHDGREAQFDGGGVRILVPKREGVKQQRHGQAEIFKPCPLRREEIASAEHGLVVGSGYRGMECQQIDCAGCEDADEADGPGETCVAEVDEDEEQDKG